MRYFTGKRRSFGPAEPKPFSYIELSQSVDRTSYIPHEKIDSLTGKLHLKIHVVSDYLFVGSGGYDFRESDNLVYYTFFRRGGDITIPGTSVKGAVRSVVEAISNSCVSLTKRGERYPSSHMKCDFDPDRNRTNLCPSCKIFGTTGYSGRVNFSDAQAEKRDLEIVKIGELFSPRISQQKRKLYQNKKINPIGNLIPEENYRFVEAVKKDSIFTTTLNFHNLLEAELSMLLYSMGINQEYMIKIGGAKPRCFGTVKFQPVEIKLLNKDAVLTKEKMFENKDMGWIKGIMKNEALINKPIINKFKEVMKPMSESEKCPKANY